MSSVIVGLTVAVIASTAVYAAFIRAGHGGSHKRDAVVACGSVLSARKAVQLRGEPEFLTLGRAYADKDLTIVLLGDRRASFGMPEELVGHWLCVSGYVRNFLGEPRMILGSSAE